MKNKSLCYSSPARKLRVVALLCGLLLVSSAFAKPAVTSPKHAKPGTHKGVTDSRADQAAGHKKKDARKHRHHPADKRQTTQLNNHTHGTVSITCPHLVA